MYLLKDNHLFRKIDIIQVWHIVSSAARERNHVDFSTLSFKKKMFSHLCSQNLNIARLRVTRNFQNIELGLEVFHNVFPCLHFTQCNCSDWCVNDQMLIKVNWGKCPKGWCNDMFSVDVTLFILTNPYLHFKQWLNRGDADIRAGPEVIKRFFVLNRAEHEILTALNYWNSQYQWKCQV